MLRRAPARGVPLPHQSLTLLWAVERIGDGVRLRRWSEVRDELAAALVAGGVENRGRVAPEYPVVALRHSPLWEIRASSAAPAAHSSQPRRWLDREDPEFGLSAPAFELLRDERNREQFAAALHRLLDRAAGPAGPDAGFWEIQPGVVVVRRDVHAQYGGRRQGGIGPSRSTPNVLLFTDPVRGRSHGYFDGWGDDGCFHYTGEGQLGDQRMVQGNQAILGHRRDGRTLRLFRVVRDGVEYLGAFEIDPDRPWYTSEAPETNGGPLRTVIMFRLRPQGPVQSIDADLPETPTTISRVTSVPVEASNAEQYAMTSPAEPTTAFRREAALVGAYSEHLRSLGHEVCRKRILPPNEPSPLFTDLFDETTGELIEAKGTVTREAVRMAIGQLIDYRRFFEPPPRLVLLVPRKPRPDLLDLCSAAGVSVVWGSDASSTPTWTIN